MASIASTTSTDYFREQIGGTVFCTNVVRVKNEYEQALE